ncbi:MAG: hypothetical protein Q4B70_18875, partial [Lachnospiraceae bacterium]|nr:hypothetical protein [Lachnospiraceae bacterium]
MNDFMFCLRQVAGFLVQTVPCIYLSFAAFYHNEIRFNKSKVIAILCIFQLFSGSVLALLVFYEKNISWLAQVPYENIYISIDIFIYIIAFWYVVIADKYQKIFVLNYFILFAAIVFLSTNMILGRYPGYYTYVDGIYSDATLLLYCVTTLCFFPPAFLFIKYKFRKFIHERPLSDIKKYTKVFICENMLYFFIV